MDYAVLMAALDLDLPTRGVLTASARLADLFGARTVGVAAGEATISPYFAEGPVADKFIAATEAELRTQLKSIEGAFREANSERRDRIEWRSAERLPDGFILSSARAADLIVVAKPPPMSNLMRGPDVGNLMLQAGRPVLAVPADVEDFAVECVLIAWKDTREARRALSDALPILKKADEVHLLVIHEPETNEAAVIAGADDVVNFLARHGVKAIAVAQPDYGSVGKAIEEYASEIDADIIVAGAFGHSRFMEWLLGGVTRHLLRSPNVNVLFSH